MLETLYHRTQNTKNPVLPLLNQSDTQLAVTGKRIKFPKIKRQQSY